MLNPFDSAYHDLCNDILEIGNQRDDRTHTGTISKFGHQIRFDLTKDSFTHYKKYLSNLLLLSYCGL